MLAGGELSPRHSRGDASITRHFLRQRLANFVFFKIRSKIPVRPPERVLVSFSVNVRQTERVALVELTGRFTSFESKAFRDMIQDLVKQGQTNIVLNLSALDYLDSSGVGELVRNYMTIVKKGGAMKVVGLAPKVEEILKVTQLYQVFPEFPDEASALESFPTEQRSSTI
jgi:anti-sigma B factor antagonist